MVIPDTDSETAWIVKAQSGDRNAYGELVRRHQRGVVNVIYRMCGDAELAQDAAQDAFIKAWHNLRAFHPGSSLRNWLYRIAVNTALDALRRQSNASALDWDDLELPDPQASPEAALLRKERAAAVQQAVLGLSEASRAVLVLREYSELSYQEIATALDIPLGTVMSRLNYARVQLKDSLQPHLLQMEMEHG